MVLVHAFEYIGNPFEEVRGHVGDLLTLDVKEKMNDDVEQKTGSAVKTGQQQYNILVNMVDEKFVEKCSSIIPSNKNKRYKTQGNIWSDI